MEHTKNKAITFVNDALRSYVRAPKRFSAGNIAFIAVTVLAATVVGGAFASHMVPPPPL